MIIKKLLVTENEKAVATLSFQAGLTVVKNSDLILDCLFGILGTPYSKCYCQNHSFTADVQIDTLYSVHGHKPKGASCWEITVSRKSSTAPCTAEYCQLLAGHSETDALTYFHQFKTQKYPHRLEQYKDDRQYYPAGGFALATNGYGTTRSFRGFMAQYIRYFKPVKLRDDKNFYLHLLPNGRFAVLDTNGDEIKTLSACENLLYHFYSFLALADFWSRAEKIRNLNRINKPLIISQFCEFLDDSIDRSGILLHTKKAGRQVIVLADT